MVPIKSRLVCVPANGFFYQFVSALKLPFPIAFRSVLNESLMGLIAN